MKNIFYISGLLFLCLAGTSCSDDFLARNNRDLYIISDTLFIKNDEEYIDTTIDLPVTINSYFKIFLQPKWFEFDSMDGTIKNGEVPLSFRVVKDKLIPWYPDIYQTYYANLILDVESTGLISMTVAYDYFGYPTIEASTTVLDYDITGSRTFAISNTTDGILDWKISGQPDWLLFSETSGILNKGNSITITACIDPSTIPQGNDISANFIIESNSTTGNVTFQVHISKEVTIPNDFHLITGIVTDAEYNHERGIMAICTKSPNSLILFNTLTDEYDIIDLAMTPACISLSEDGYKAVIGYSEGSVGYVDIDNQIITRDFMIDCIPFDIVLGDDAWCYITPFADQWVNFRNLNLITGELVIIPSVTWSAMYEKTFLSKVPGKPYLIGTRTTLSPSGLVIYDISNGIANEVITYYHASIGKFLISNDTTKLYCATKDVYLLPAFDAQYHVSSPILSGQINSEFNSILSLDECPATTNIFVVFGDFNYSLGTFESSPSISQYSTVNLARVREFDTAPVFISENGINTIYETSARYIFASKDGSELYAIKNLKESYKKDYWTVETVKLARL